MMLKPGPREAARLSALYDYEVLDTGPEEAFDRLSALAADLFDAPIALVSLVDVERQWFKTRVGLEASSTPRKVSFCAHAIEGGAGETFVVEDATRDDRFRHNPLVTGDPNIRFYAGAVLTTPAGFNLGTICVIDAKPRPSPDALQLARLQKLANIVVDELELRRAMRELEAARLATEHALAVKSEFLANMSHELRTPLTAILGYASLMQVRHQLEPEPKRFAGRIEAASRRLLTTINDVLDFSKLEAGRFEIRPQPTDVRALTASVVGVLEQSAVAKGVSLTLDVAAETPAQVLIDPDRLAQVLTNLIGNGLKFTEAGSVAVTATYDADERLTVRITDTGPGMSPEQTSVLFQRFSQVDGSSRRTHGGTGLGLAISKGLVEAMGGEIGMETTLGLGSTFWFAAPAPAVQELAG
jgi:signal transduction histidine kinase